jgi:hypothetical protein
MSTSPHNPTSAESTSDRAPKGRFRLGNKGGPGNPFARQVAEIRKLLLNTVPGERLANIVLAMVDKAEAGDVAAAKLVLQYTVGKPAEAVEPDRIELEDHRLRVESCVTPDRWSPKFGELSAESANSLWEAAAPEMEQQTMLPVILGALEVEAAPPEMKERVQRKTNRRTMRILQEGIAPSPNGAIGRKLAKLRRRLDKHGGFPTKPARAG